MGTRLDSITTDNGANFKAAVQQLLDEDVTEENPACACHTFSLVVIKIAIDPCKKKVTLLLKRVATRVHMVCQMFRFLIMLLGHSFNFSGTSQMQSVTALKG